MRYAFEYTEGMRIGLRAAKYSPSFHLAKEYATRCATLFKDIYRGFDLSSWDIITVIPQSQPGSKRRPFNFPKLIAYSIWNVLGDKDLKLQEVLKHTKYKKSQATLRLKSRMSNMKNQWTVTADVSGLRILLIDDLVTSGSTVLSAANALLSAGAKSVDIFSLTRSTTFNRVRDKVEKELEPDR